MSETFKRPEDQTLRGIAPEGRAQGEEAALRDGSRWIHPTPPKGPTEGQKLYGAALSALAALLRYAELRGEKDNEVRAERALTALIEGKFSKESDE